MSADLQTPVNEERRMWSPEHGEEGRGQGPTSTYRVLVNASILSCRMSTHPLHVIYGGLTGDAAFDTAISRAILQQVDSGELPATLQVGMPHRVVAFGKQDSIMSGFANAVDAARVQGFDTTVRIAGGRAVVFHSGTVRFAWTAPVEAPADTIHARFASLTQAVVATLADFDVAAEVGELPDEYCAGSYSVHLKNGAKVMGVGQRLARHAAQVGGMIVVDDSSTINAVLEPIYGHLGIAFDPDMTGAVSDVRRLEPDLVAAVLAERLAPDGAPVPSSVDAATLDLGASLRRDHVPQHLRERTKHP
jgi:octanoyl-[GcvH]:protein N-octanoyltransferase